nr:hypothetical protein [Photobacterium obscurum]
MNQVVVQRALPACVINGRGIGFIALLPIGPEVGFGRGAAGSGSQQ